MSGNKKPNSNKLKVYDKFENMNLSKDLLRGIYGRGYEKPSSIQQRGIVPLCNGFDIIGQGQSGTGKTVTFVIGILHSLDFSLNECQALIIAPTRELSLQIKKDILALGKYVNVRCCSCIGGTKIADDITKFQSEIQVVVGTPGRILNLISRGALNTSHIKLIILDEADQILMFSRGLKKQTFDIFHKLQTKTQVAIFSSTMPPEVLEITKIFMDKPLRILVKTEELTLEGIFQYYIFVEKENWKLDTLCDLYNTISNHQAVIFCNTRSKVNWLSEELRSREFNVSATHGGIRQKKRDAILNDFIRGSTNILITTDLIARGIDVQQLRLVINYDLPLHLENYIHRIGRSGRYGRKGVSINLITTSDVKTQTKLETLFNTSIDEMPAFIPYLK